MSAVTRRLLIALAVLVAVAAAAALYLVATFDPNRYKGLLIDWVREHQQRTLAIDGPISLSVFPRLAVTLRDVTLSEHRRPEEFAALQEATLAVQVLPLLRRQLAVDRVAASGVRVVYARDSKGVSNIDDLLATNPPPAAPASAAASTPLQFDVSGVSLQDLQATVTDAVLGIDGRFVVKKLETGRLADGAKSPVAFSGQAVLKQPAMDAAIDLTGQLQLRLPGGAPADVDLTDLKLAVRGNGFQVKQLDARLTGALAWQGASGAVQADALALTLSGERLGIALKDSTVALRSLRFDPPQRALQLDALDVKLAGQQAPGAGFTATLAWPSLSVEGDALKGSALQGGATLSGAQTVTMAFASQAPSGSFERIRVPGVKVSVDGQGGGRSVRGEVRCDLTLAPKPLAIALDALDAALQFTDPALPPMKLAVRGQARATADAADAALDGSINDQKFALNVKAALAKAVPDIDATARFDALDLTRFVAPRQAASGAPAAKPAADTPVDLSGLRALDGRFSLRAGSLVYPPYRVADAALDATLANGRLDVSQLAGRAWGGRFTASASAQAAPAVANQRVAFKLDANGVDIAQLLDNVAQFKRLEGSGRVSADLSTRGASVSQFKQQLGGRAAVQLTDGAVRGVNLAKVLRQWRSAVSLDKDAAQASNQDEKTDFSEIVASFAIADGVARNSDLSAKSPFLRVGGEGTVDIGKGRVDYLARATVTGTPEGQGGADLAALKGVTVPVQLVGRFEAVNYKVQWSAVGAQVLTGAAKGALGEKAKGALGGLLGLPATPASGASAADPKEQIKDAAKERAKEELKKLLGR